MTAALEVIGVHKSFGGRQILNDFSLRIDRGETVGLLGPNGCGKTTLLNVIANLVSKDKGQVLFMGQPIETLGKPMRSLVAVCSQRSSLYPELLPAENLLFFARLYGLSEKDCKRRVAELMSDFELEEFATTRAGRLSGGWQQRLHIAVSVINRPAFLMLDEPTAAVDVEARLDLWNFIGGLRDQGTTILMTTHHLTEADRLCNRVALMRDGAVVAVGHPAELLSRLPGKAVAQVTSVDTDGLFKRAKALGWPTRQGMNEVRLFLPAVLSLREIVDALDGVNLSSLSTRPLTLEDVYLELVGGLAPLERVALK